MPRKIYFPKRIFLMKFCFRKFGGEGEIRTHGSLSTTLVFKTSALNHSATSPHDGYNR